MIKIEEFVSNIENALNANNYGLFFKLFIDDGKFKGKERIYTTISKTINKYNAQTQTVEQTTVETKTPTNEFKRYICGIASTISSSLTPIKSLEIQTTTLELRFIIDVEAQETDENGNYIEVLQIEDILRNFATDKNGKTETLVDANNNTYLVSTNLDLPIVGVEQQLSPLGRCLPISMNIYYTLVENGVNSNDVEITVAGEQMPFTDATIERVSTAEASQLVDTESAKTAIEQSAISVALNIPITTTEVSKFIVESILKQRNNYALPVEINYTSLNIKKYYIMTLKQQKNALSGVQNVGAEIVLTEVVDSVAELFDINKQIGMGYWITEELSSGVDFVKNFQFSAIPNGYVFIDWGDGSVLSYRAGENPAQVYTHSYSAGTYKIRCFCGV